MAPGAEAELVKRAVEPLGWQFVSITQRRDPNKAHDDRSILLFSRSVRTAGVRAAAPRLGAQAVRAIQDAGVRGLESVVVDASAPKDDGFQRWDPQLGVSERAAAQSSSGPTAENPAEGIHIFGSEAAARAAWADTGGGRGASGLE